MGSRLCERTRSPPTCIYCAVASFQHGKRKQRRKQQAVVSTQRRILALYATAPAARHHSEPIKGCHCVSVDERRHAPEKLRIARRRSERLETPASERPLLAQGHASLEELLASGVVRRVMKRDGVDPSDVRKLITSVANAIAGSR
jgi:hypothetical protein